MWLGPSFCFGSEGWRRDSGGYSGRRRVVWRLGRRTYVETRIFSRVAFGLETRVGWCRLGAAVTAGGDHALLNVCFVGMYVDHVQFVQPIPSGIAS